METVPLAIVTVPSPLSVSVTFGPLVPPPGMLAKTEFDANRNPARPSAQQRNTTAPCLPKSRRGPDVTRNIVTRSHTVWFQRVISTIAKTGDEKLGSAAL